MKIKAFVIVASLFSAGAFAESGLMLDCAFDEAEKSSGNIIIKIDQGGKSSVVIYPDHSEDGMVLSSENFYEIDSYYMKEQLNTSIVINRLTTDFFISSYKNGEEAPDQQQARIPDGKCSKAKHEQQL